MTIKELLKGKFFTASTEEELDAMHEARKNTTISVNWGEEYTVEDFIQLNIPIESAIIDKNTIKIHLL